MGPRCRGPARRGKTGWQAAWVWQTILIGWRETISTDLALGSGGAELRPKQSSDGGMEKIFILIEINILESGAY